MKSLFFVLALSFSSHSFAESQPPNNLNKVDYENWLNSFGSVVSPFNDYVFAWYESQKSSPLPPQVAQDPEKLFVSIDKPLAETIEFEDAGDIEAGVTYGLETYAVIDAPIQFVRDTMLFKWGKPLGEREGVTYPVDTVFGYRQEALKERWNSSAWETITLKTGGGFAKDQRDVFSLLMYGDEQSGYVLVGSFTKPNGVTTTTTSISIMMMKPTADGKTEYRVSGRLMGQNYSFLGIGYGRKNFGFNKDRIRVGQKEFIDAVYTLKRTGRLPERRP